MMSQSEIFLCVHKLTLKTNITLRLREITLPSSFKQKKKTLPSMTSEENERKDTIFVCVFVTHACYILLLPLFLLLLLLLCFHKDFVFKDYLENCYKFQEKHLGITKEYTDIKKSPYVKFKFMTRKI
jgi:hypothetical protein